MVKKPDSGKDARADRLAQALRDNLRRRKAQTRARRAGEEDVASPPEDAAKPPSSGPDISTQPGETAAEATKKGRQDG